MTRFTALRLAARLASTGDAPAAREVVARHVRPGSPVVIEVNATLPVARVRPALVIGTAWASRVPTERKVFDAEASSTAWIAEMRGGRP